MQRCGNTAIAKRNPNGSSILAYSNIIIFSRSKYFKMVSSLRTIYSRFAYYLGKWHINFGPLSTNRHLAIGPDALMAPKDDHLQNLKIEGEQFLYEVYVHQKRERIIANIPTFSHLTITR